MSDLKRDLIKYCRDKAKSAYNKGDKCYICSSTEELDFHHFNSMTEMLNKWLKLNKLNPTTVDEIVSCRDRFIAEHYEQVYNETVTLCHMHHLKLHSIYGKTPPLTTAKKQIRWVDKQRAKYVVQEKEES